MLIVIIFLNSYPGRCGDWEALASDEVRTVIAKADVNVLRFKEHKTIKEFGAILKWVPGPVLQALRMYAEMPFVRGKNFITPHTGKSQRVCVTRLLHEAEWTLGFEGTVHDSSFIRKVFATQAYHCQQMDLVRQQRDSKVAEVLAALDGHNFGTAKSLHYNMASKSARLVEQFTEAAYRIVMKADPVAFNEDVLSTDDFKVLYQCRTKHVESRKEVVKAKKKPNCPQPAKKRARVIKHMSEILKEVIVKKGTQALCRAVASEVNSRPQRKDCELDELVREGQVRYVISGK
jgi:hypothetical protein